MAALLTETSGRTRSIQLILAAPRGFCAGVERAIQIVERTIEKFGAPVYVRHEIVHNTSVVERLQRMGAIFVDDLAECPDDRPVVFSAHGVPRAVPREAARRNMIHIDGTCPLVSKVHIEAQRHHRAGREILLIGHDGHPEVIGTMGQLPEGAVTLIETIADATRFEPQDSDNLAFVTQTTLSMDEVAGIVGALRRRFPGIVAPHKDDVCYATTNRQEAVKMIAPDADLVLVVGSRTSSNACRLVEMALKSGARAAHLVEDVTAIDWSWFEGSSMVGLTSGASTPEDLVAGIIEAICARFDTSVVEIFSRREDVRFRLPRMLD